MNAPLTYSSLTSSVEALKHSIAYRLMFTIGKNPVVANKHEWLNATLFAVRDRLAERWPHSSRAQLSQETCQVYYLSMGFLIGRTLSNAMLSLGIYKGVQDVLEAMGLNLGGLVDEENDPGLGNGGLGRLAVCFFDSLAALGLLEHGYGIRYGYSMFKQDVVDDSQKESSDYWLKYNNPWEFKYHNTRYRVHFGGCIQQEGRKTRWIEIEEILGIAYNQIIPGYDTNATNALHLQSVQASSEINSGKFNQGDCLTAVEDKDRSESVSHILYPDDSTHSGRELCLRQEYFLISSTIQDILSRHHQLHKTYDNPADKIAIHLSDIHPVLSIPKMMRLLVDEYQFSWDDMFEVCCQVFSYTNRTLMSRALGAWPADALGKILPRHLQIILEINDYFLKTLQEQYPNDIDLLGRTLITDESNGRRAHMTWLAVAVSRRASGVSELHSNLMVQSLFADLVRTFPGRFTNTINGVTPRRWLVVANSSPSVVLDERLDRSWCADLSLLNELQQHCDFSMINRAVRQARLESKKRLIEYIIQQLDAVANSKTLLDVQIKRIHEHKRQLMNVLHVIIRYSRTKTDPDMKWVLYVNILDGKAASAYYMAKHTTHLINDIVKVINSDSQIDDKLKVVFIPNYSVSLAQLIIPATDLSEQISLVGTGASGTGNMRLVLNGVLTTGMLDGMNIEMSDHVSANNIFIFGNIAEGVEKLRRQGYRPREYYEEDEELHQVLTQIGSGVFSPEDPGRYRGLVDSLTNFGDRYQVLTDYRSHIDCQDKVGRLYELWEEWTAKAMLNIANMGYFSSDRIIKECVNHI